MSLVRFDQKTAKSQRMQAELGTSQNKLTQTVLKPKKLLVAIIMKCYGVFAR